MADTTRISITSLLNNDTKQTALAAPSPTIIPEFSRLNLTQQETEQTSSTIGISPSPTLSQLSISSDTSSTTGRAPYRQRSGSSESSATAKHAYRPYDPNERPRSRRGTREFRPSYRVEESYFIWYHRLDLGLDWSQVSARYNRYFKRQRSGCQGFQCKFYRFLQEHGLPPVRERNKDPNAPRTYALRTWEPDVWYPWMQPGVTELPRH